MTVLTFAALLALVPAPARADVAPEPAPSGGCKCASAPAEGAPTLLLGLALGGVALSRRRR